MVKGILVCFEVWGLSDNMPQRAKKRIAAQGFMCSGKETQSWLSISYYCTQQLKLRGYLCRSMDKSQSSDVFATRTKKCHNTIG